jgi:hypothetical protein
MGFVSAQTDVSPESGRSSARFFSANKHHTHLENRMHSSPSVGQCACGGGCPRCQNRLPIQTKVAVSQPGDVHEQEADRVAEQVMRMPAPAQRKIDSGSHYVPDNFIDGLGPSEPLSEAARTFMEPRFGHDFGEVRVFTDEKAAESTRDMNALAYTFGRNIVFGAGQYAPETSNGRLLLAHELAHSIQQGAAQPEVPRKIARRGEDERQLETSQAALPTIQLKRVAAPLIQRQGTADPTTVPATPLPTPQTATPPPPAAGAPTAPSSAPAATPTPCEQGINETTAEALTWIHDAVEQLTTYEGQQAAASGTASPDIARIATALNYNFHTSDFQYTRLIRDRLRIMETRVRARTDLTVVCAASGDQECAVTSFRHSTEAYAQPNRVVFCDVGTAGNRPVSTFIHELAHAVVPNLGTLLPIATQADTPSDRAYAHQRVYRYLSVEEALDNAESYASLVNHLHQRQTTPSPQLPTDTLTNCAQPDLVNSALARAENWNLMGYRWLRAAEDLLSTGTGGLAPEDEARLTGQSFGVGRSDIQRLVANLDILLESFNNGANVRCVAAGGRCSTGVLGFARTYAVTTTAVRTGGPAASQFFINLCPAWMIASPEDQIRTIYALFILSRPDWMTNDSSRNVLLQRTDTFHYVDLARTLTAHVMSPPRASTLAEHQLSDMGIRLQELRRQLDQISTQLERIGVRLNTLQSELERMQRELNALQLR